MVGKIGFVEGTDEYGASPPEGYSWRFAVLTWICDGHDQIDPWELIHLAIARIQLILNLDHVVAEYWQRTTRWFGSVGESKLSEIVWSDLIQSVPLSDLDFPSRWRFEKDKETIIFAESEMWALVGGPVPYHDSVTISFFSRNDQSAMLRSIFTEIATQLQIEVEAEYQPNKPVEESR